MLLLLIMAASHGFSQQSSLITYYEESNFLRTPRYDETLKYCHLLAESSSMIEYTEFGNTGLGRKLPLLIISKNKQFTPVDASKSGNTIVLIQACIHPGESDGKDAGLVLFRDLMIGKINPVIIDNLTILFIPIYNVDGHERFGPYNRINQKGPQEMGWRTNAQNLNLNRDYIKADAPETIAWLNLFNHWEPHFIIDIHVTNGADYQYAITYSMETGGNMDSNLTLWQSEEFIPSMEKAMEQMESPIFHYVSFRRWHDPRSGISARVATPRQTHGYTALRNRPGLLVETHMLKDYKTRVDATYKLLAFTLEYLSKNGRQLQYLIAASDLAGTTMTLQTETFPLQFKLSSDSVMLLFKGFEYSMEKSELSGGNWFKYSSTPSEFYIPFFNQNNVSKSASLPLAYILPPQYTDVISRMNAHGIVYRFSKEEVSLNIPMYYVYNPVWGKTPQEGRIRLNHFDLTDTVLHVSFPAGSLIIPVSQPHRKVIAHILEPNSPDSYLSWGFFNAIFEQKEYAENYVMEKLAREMLETDPDLKLEFEQLKKDKTEILNNQWELLNWFYSKTPYWDTNKNIYPVGRLFTIDQLTKFN